jgi:hypothetical protein
MHQPAISIQAAMLNNDPSLELFSRDCKFTENGVRLPLGNEGLWLNMSAKGNYISKFLYSLYLVSVAKLSSYPSPEGATRK